MRLQTVTGIPKLHDFQEHPTLYVSGSSALLNSMRTTARITLPTASLEWLIERPVFTYAEDVRWQHRYLLVGLDNVVWFSETQPMMAELLAKEDGTASVVGRKAVTGELAWKHSVLIPNAAPWAEAVPAWLGAQTEEIGVFIADDPKHLVICSTRHSRRSMCSGPNGSVDWLPPFASQLDAVALDLATGAVRWQASYPDIYVGMAVAPPTFSGLWSTGRRVGVIDWTTGRNTILAEFPHELGWPVRDGANIAIPWRSPREVGVFWIDSTGRRVHETSWPVTKVNRVALHTTDAGLALQTNDQQLWWLGHERSPQWNVRAKPYIYRVFAEPGRTVFVGTDGNGGRLFGFDIASGHEVLHVRPARHGFGWLTRIPAHPYLVSTFGVSRSSRLQSPLLRLDVRDNQYILGPECFLIVGTWEHGVIVRLGPSGEHLGVVDMRGPIGETTSNPVRAVRPPSRRRS